MAENKTGINYVLDHQVGFLLRRANQRHTGLFSRRMPEGVTPTRFAALVKLHEHGAVSQNRLGRLTAMDVATIKGVVDRLRDRGLVTSARDTEDARRQLVSLTDAGRALVDQMLPVARDVTAETIAPLSPAEARMLEELLTKIS